MFKVEPVHIYTFASFSYKYSIAPEKHLLLQFFISSMKVIIYPTHAASHKHLRPLEKTQVARGMGCI